MSNIWVNGIVAVRDGKPYIQLSNEKGMIAQLSMSETRQIAMDMLVMAARTEMDSMLHRFCKERGFPGEAAGGMTSQSAKPTAPTAEPRYTVGPPDKDGRRCVSEWLEKTEEYEEHVIVYRRDRAVLQKGGTQ